MLDLTGLDIASASLLDEATVADEVMALAKHASKSKQANLFRLRLYAFSNPTQILDVIHAPRPVGTFDLWPCAGDR
ncbi:hypothetical protein [Sodalis-like endosymbiont of Proechinophthirus fluctus]|uniref:hypothetical protein n=1 Tax=Sodalis-like endosymbiont of Proechinophthirus fluctus TaxID=1462730 RepID=UPI003F75421A